MLAGLKNLASTERFTMNKNISRTNGAYDLRCDYTNQEGLDYGYFEHFCFVAQDVLDVIQLEFPQTTGVWNTETVFSKLDDKHKCHIDIETPEGLVSMLCITSMGYEIVHQYICHLPNDYAWMACQPSKDVWFNVDPKKSRCVGELPAPKENKSEGNRATKHICNERVRCEKDQDISTFGCFAVGDIHNIHESDNGTRLLGYNQWKQEDGSYYKTLAMYPYNWQEEGYEDEGWYEYELRDGKAFTFLDWDEEQIREGKAKKGQEKKLEAFKASFLQILSGK